MNNQKAIDDFWSESCLFYQFENVKSYLLKLQNDYDKNINRLLFSLWFTHYQKRMLSEKEINIINSNTELLEIWIKEIRRLRNNKSEITDNLIKRILDFELKLEKIHQITLINSINLKLSRTDLLETDLLNSNLERLCGTVDNKAYQLLNNSWFEFIKDNN